MYSSLHTRISVHHSLVSTSNFRVLSSPAAPRLRRHTLQSKAKATSNVMVPRVWVRRRKVDPDRSCHTRRDLCRINCHVSPWASQSDQVLFYVAECGRIHLVFEPRFHQHVRTLGRREGFGYGYNLKLGRLDVTEKTCDVNVSIITHTNIYNGILWTYHGLCRVHMLRPICWVG